MKKPNETKVLPEPIEVYYETAVNSEGTEYTYPVYVYAPQVDPREKLNPAYAYGS